MASRGRPLKDFMDRSDVRKAFLLASVAYLRDTGEARTISHACKILAGRMQDEAWEKEGSNRSLTALLEDDHKNAKRSESARLMEVIAFYRVKSRSLNATKADAAAWLLNLLDEMDR